MTFEDFKQLCDQVKTTGQQVTAPCPIVIGTGEIHAAVGDTPTHHLIIFNTDAANPALRDIYRTVMFTFDAANNQTVIAPITHA